jgi:L-alanine-DL-glutamate epimerase-like enolase superfamily enzyme
MISHPETKPSVSETTHTPLPQETFDIREVSIRSLEPVRFQRPFYDATMGPFGEYRFSVLRITDASGFSGECEYPTDYIWMLKSFFVPVLLEGGSLTYSELFKKMYWRIRNEGFRGASGLVLGHIDKVFYDLAAKRESLPVYRYLGGSNPRVTAYGSGGGNNLVGTELEDELLRWEAEGYRTVKMKFGCENSTIKEDVERIARIRQVLRPETQLAVDANQFMELPRALEFIKALKGLDIAWLEEPVHSAALHEIRALSEQSWVKIAYGESERSAKVFPSLVAAGVDTLQPIAGSICSIEEWFDVVQLGKEHQLDLSCGGVSYFNCQFAAAAPTFVLQEFLEPVLGSLETLFSVMPTIKNGEFLLSEEPGLGIQVDWERLEREKRVSGSQVWQ